MLQKEYKKLSSSYIVKVLVVFYWKKAFRDHVTYYFLRFILKQLPNALDLFT